MLVRRQNIDSAKHLVPFHGLTAYEERYIVTETHREQLTEKKRAVQRE